MALIRTRRSMHLYEQRSKALSSSWWMQVIPKKPFAMFLRSGYEYA